MLTPKELILAINKAIPAPAMRRGEHQRRRSFGFAAADLAENPTKRLEPPEGGSLKNNLASFGAEEGTQTPAF
jgi:hypothetical protein